MWAVFVLFPVLNNNLVARCLLDAETFFIVYYHFKLSLVLAW